MEVYARDQTFFDPVLIKPSITYKMYVNLKANFAIPERFSKNTLYG